MSIITQIEKQLHDYSETLAFICWNVAQNGEWIVKAEKKYIKEVGTIGLLNIFIEWANEFQDMYGNTDWGVEIEWIETLSDFIYTKLD